MEFVFNPQKIVIGQTGLAGLYQEINTLLTTHKGSVPLDRNFGISWDFIDSPINEAKPAIVQELVMQIEKYIPRIEVTSIEFVNNFNMDGKLYPKIIFKIRKEYEKDFL